MTLETDFLFNLDTLGNKLPAEPTCPLVLTPSVLTPYPGVTRGRRGVAWPEDVGFGPRTFRVARQQGQLSPRGRDTGGRANH